jgi:hypothetical protein
METWRKVWRKGIAPTLSTPALKAIEQALETNDPRLIQGATTSPPPLACVSDWEPDACCLLTYGGWQGDGKKTILDLEQFFADRCNMADDFLGEVSGCRWFLNFWDESPREQVFPLVLEEVKLALKQREKGCV